MTANRTSCPDCGAVLVDGTTCDEHFHQMLFWEFENPANGEVHHLAVLCYHLQHPRLYSPAGLRGAVRLLADFIEGGTSPAQAREAFRARLSSGPREKIKGTLESHGEYATPPAWTLRAGDVVAAGEPRYRESVRAWARSIFEELRRSGNDLH